MRKPVKTVRQDRCLRICPYRSSRSRLSLRSNFLIILPFSRPDLPRSRAILFSSAKIFILFYSFSVLLEASVMLTRFTNPPQQHVVISGAQHPTPAWCLRVESNHHPPRYERGAPPVELRRHIVLIGASFLYSLTQHHAAG